jgi:hypothetical protein
MGNVVVVLNDNKDKFKEKLKNLKIRNCEFLLDCDYKIGIQEARLCKLYPLYLVTTNLYRNNVLLEGLEYTFFKCP